MRRLIVAAFVLALAGLMPTATGLGFFAEAPRGSHGVAVADPLPVADMDEPEMTTAVEGESLRIEPVAAPALIEGAARQLLPPRIVRES